MLTRIGGVLLVVLTQQPASAPASEAELDKRLANAARVLVPDHLAIAKKCRELKLGKQAAKEWTQALALDPNNTEARAGLGYKLDNGAWVETKAPPPSDSSREKLDEIWPRRNALAKKAVKELTPVAEYAASAGLGKRAREIARVIVEYDVNAAKARKVLGQVMTDDGWTSKADVEDAERLAKRIASAPAPKPAAGTSEFEARLGVKLVKLQSAHFRIEGTLGEGETMDVGKHAEAAWTDLTESVGMVAPKALTNVTFILCAGRPEFEKAIDGFSIHRDPTALAEARAAWMAWLKSSPGAILAPRNPAMLYRDSALHYVAHFIVEGWCAPKPAPAWLREGASYWTTNRVSKSANTHCSAFDIDDGTRLQKMGAWRETAREWAAAGSGPTARQVMESNLKDLDIDRIVKSRSLFDYLVRARPAELRACIQKIAAGEAGEAAAKAAFHVKDYEELDAQWREYLREYY